VPAQQKADQAGFAGARTTDNRQVFTGRQVQVDAVQNRLAAGLHLDIFEGNRHTTLTIGHGRSSRRGCMLISLFRRTQRLKQAQHGIADLRIALDLLKNRRRQQGQLERPVEQQQHLPGRRSDDDLQHNDRCNQGKEDPAEQARQQRHIQKIQAGSRPLAEQILEFAPRRPFGRVGPQRRQPLQRIEIEATERSLQGAQAHIAFLEHRPGQVGNSTGQQREEQNPEPICRHQPDNRRQRQQQFEALAQQIGADALHPVQMLQVVRPTRHIRDQATMKIAIAQPRDLAQKCQPQPNLHAAAGALDQTFRTQSQAKANQQEQQQQANQQDVLVEQLHFGTDPAQTLDQGNFQQDCGSPQQQGRQQQSRRQQAILTQRIEERAGRARLRCIARGRQFRRQFGGGGGIAAAAGYLEQHSTPHQQFFTVGVVAGRRLNRPELGRDQLPAGGAICFSCRLHKAQQDGLCIGFGSQAAIPLQRRNQPGGGIERGQPAPCRVGQRPLDQHINRFRLQRQIAQPAAQWIEHAFAAGPFAPGFRVNRHRMDEQISEEPADGHPAPPDGRIHHLHQPAMAPPDHHKVGIAFRQPDHDQRRQRLTFRQQQMIGGHHHLGGVQAQLYRNLLECIDRRAVDTGLAGLTQARITDGDIEAFEEHLERRRATIHFRSLDHFGNQPAALSVRRAIRRFRLGIRRRIIDRLGFKLSLVERLTHGSGPVAMQEQFKGRNIGHGDLQFAVHVWWSFRQPQQHNSFAVTARIGRAQHRCRQDLHRRITIRLKQQAGLLALPDSRQSCRIEAGDQRSVGFK